MFECEFIFALPTSKASWDGKVATGCTLKNQSVYTVGLLGMFDYCIKSSPFGHPTYFTHWFFCILYSRAT